MQDDESPLPDEEQERDTLTMGLGFDEPPQPKPEPAPEPPAPTPEAATATVPASSDDAAYQVLARKYRPQTFAQLIGQDAMVQTLANAIERDRLAHAFLMTGVRGVGKTSTARLIAKALNCIGPDGNGGPTIDPCGVCEPCRAIAEGRHIDVVEMDAASHTGVDDVREIIEAVRYASVSARYKIYIIDEVHMLSKSAFNALLKTLEEPPAHVKFIFATTEVDKVPVTVLSRTQRFDLKRIPAEMLADHFGKVAAKEGVEVEPEALAIIARVSEGSARDGLSLLDQAIAHGEDKVSADAVRGMLGLADRRRVAAILDTLLAGDAGAMLDKLDEAHVLGLEPAAIVRGLLDQLHGLSRAKAGGEGDVMRSAEEREAASELAGKLGWPQLHALWQLLLKALEDVRTAPDPREAADMALLRCIHAAGMPDPGAVIDALASGKAAPQPMGGAAPSPAPAPAPSKAPEASAPVETPPAAPAEPESPATSAPPSDFAAFIKALEDSGHALVAVQLHDHVGVVDYAPPLLKLQPHGPLGSDFARDLATRAKNATGIAWQVELVDEGGAPSLRTQEKMAQEKDEAAVMADPMVKAVTDAFPETTLEKIQEQR
ncbi:DNA polymerase III subunit gamma/tau [Sphingomicrobium nitratireducens]|uniref:DNA polymerase III subunit gamma/tau n=1 Tax=Sphingomicrobium nitratireducens TaxID=2964666 RepID=UPI00223ED208|nr:DNA polymerase III subunit gamma/tau [Sphingomicrobium nitratireducens]